MQKDILFVTHCSGDKNGAGGPLTLYKSGRIQRFGKVCISSCAPWAIVSAKHALFLPSERHDPYNTELAFSNGRLYVCENDDLLPNSEAHVNWLTAEVCRRLEELGIRQVVYYVGGPPQRACQYLLLMHQAVDHCGGSHYRPDDVVTCVSKTGSIYIANGMPELEAKLNEAGYAIG